MTNYKEIALTTVEILLMKLFAKILTVVKTRICPVTYHYEDMFIPLNKPFSTLITI